MQPTDRNASADAIKFCWWWDASSNLLYTYVGLLVYLQVNFWLRMTTLYYYVSPHGICFILFIWSFFFFLFSSDILEGGKFSSVFDCNRIWRIFFLFFSTKRTNWKNRASSEAHSLFRGKYIGSFRMIDPNRSWVSSN